MADRTSAQIFSELFKLLAKRIDTQEEEVVFAILSLAAEVWELSTGYDFSPYQLEADPALEALGLARKVEGATEDDFFFEYGPKLDPTEAAAVLSREIPGVPHFEELLTDPLFPGMIYPSRR